MISWLKGKVICNALFRGSAVYCMQHLQGCIWSHGGAVVGHQTCDHEVASLITGQDVAA